MAWTTEGQNGISSPSIALLMPTVGFIFVCTMNQTIATIRHAVFLHWRLSQGEGSFCEEGISTSCRRGISYEDVRDYMVVVSRMTGYEEDDIYEYLENSFEHIIWDWGYFALICG